MEKTFNSMGPCRPAKHYMVNIDRQLGEIRKLVDNGKYFVINRARQYGKTTTLRLLKKVLINQYLVFSISFEGIEREAYAGAASFCQRFCRLLYDSLLYNEAEGIPDVLNTKLEEIKHKSINLADLSDLISDMCRHANKPVVLMIDEVDQASGQEIFLSFLGMLRNKYIESDERPTFQSVILAGVYDIKNLKLKLRPDTLHQYNSPWNIAVNFTVDMSFSPKDIAGMLQEYEEDHHTGMDIDMMSGMLYEYTSGYPFLVSRLCELMDAWMPEAEKGAFSAKAEIWTKDGLLKAVRELLRESNTLFDDIVKKLNDFPELKKILYSVLFQGQYFSYNIDHLVLQIGCMFGLFKNHQDTVAIANRIFETRIYNYFLSEEMVDSKIYKAADMQKNHFVQNGQLDMELVLERFIKSFNDIYSDAGETFLEENGRRFFLLYLKPIINGIGNYYIEARTRDMRRTDVVIDYCGNQYVCELKIWRGDEYNKRGEEQLLGYLDDYHLTTGYMLSFNFNKNKKTGMKKLQINGKTLIEAIV